jgi:hypothetical protein
MNQALTLTNQGWQAKEIDSHNRKSRGEFDTPAIAPVVVTNSMPALLRPRIHEVSHSYAEASRRFSNLPHSLRNLVSSCFPGPRKNFSRSWTRPLRRKKEDTSCAVAPFPRFAR